MTIIGQEKLQAKLNMYTDATLPKVLLFIGEVGCGKKYIASRFAEMHNVQYKVIVDKDELDNEHLQQYLFCPIKTIYIIKLNAFDDKQQNKLLKFIEEPSSTVHVILTADSDVGLLPTIMNRCLKFYFEPYTVDQLKQFNYLIGNVPEEIFEICSTPGQLKDINIASFSKLSVCCNNLLANIKNYTYAQTIKYSTFINYKEDYNKFDYLAFLKTIKYTAVKKYADTSDPLMLTVFNVVNKAIAQLQNISIAKEWYIINFLSNLWSCVHNEIK